MKDFMRCQTLVKFGRSIGFVVAEAEGMLGGEEFSSSKRYAVVVTKR